MAPTQIKMCQRLNNNYDYLGENIQYVIYIKNFSETEIKLQNH